MILGLRTDGNVTVFKLNMDGQTSEQQWESGRQLSEQIMDKIENFLNEHDTAVQNLSGMVVFRGPGSFTGLRIGASVANAMAYALRIPIVGAQNDDWFESGVKLIAQGQNHKQVVPEYGGEANITKPRK